MPNIQIQKNWSVQGHENVWKLAVSETVCFAILNRSKLVCIELANGEISWQRKIHADSLSFNDLFVFATANFSLFCFSQQDGSIVWQKPLPPPELFSEPVQQSDFYHVGSIRQLSVSSDLLMVGGWRGYSPIYCFDRNGKFLWLKGRADGDPYGHRFLYTSNGEPLAFIYHQEKLIQVDPYSGTTKKEYSLPSQGAIEFNDILHDQHYQDWSGKATEWLLCEPDSAWRLHLNPEPEIVKYITAEKIICFRSALVASKLIYISSDRHLKLFDSETGLQEDWGLVDHNGRNRLPLIKTPTGLTIVGTSFGHLFIFSSTGQLLKRQKLTRRILTELAWTNGSIIFGSASGEVLSYKIDELP